MYSEKVQTFLNKKKIKIGDEIRLIKNKKNYEGILMPRIELGDLSCLVIKLSNGYNVGIKFEIGVKIKKLKGHRKLERFPVRKFKQRPDLPKVSLLATGGTIASRIDYLTGGVKMAFKPEEFFFAVPDLANIISFKKIKLLSCLASEDLWYKNWQQIAEEASKEFNKGARGVIITHGTDVMHFSSAALSFMLKDLNGPVVFTGAQRSSDRGSSDTVMNLICSAHIVGYSDFAEVGVCMHAESSDTFCFFSRGTKVRKCHTSRRDAFRPINDLPLAKVWSNGKIETINDNYRKISKGRVKTDTKFEPKIALLKAYPGSDPKVIDYFVKNGVKGIVVEGTGLGHVPTSTPEKKMSWIPHVKNAIESGIPVVVTSQCIWGRVHPYVYKNLRILDSTGVIWGQDMLSEVAYVKLGWVLAHAKDLKKIREMMLTNYAGEISKRSDPETFLY
jgi:glutamyl-tRNA(Gln) amidotransferase subunit D